MALGLGFGLAGAVIQQGVDAILVKPKRAIGPFKAHATVSERHVDSLEITDHPVEAGSQMSDHAFKRPPRVIIECCWSDSVPARGVVAGLGAALSGTAAFAQAVLTGSGPSQIRDVYAKLVALQESAVPFDVLTGKRAYTDMLLEELSVETDRENENVLRVQAVCRKVFIATVRVVTVGAPAEAQADPASTLPSADRGTRQLLGSPPNFNLSASVDALTPQVGD